ncbi:MAG: D-TA family PLP-dependent enzyme [Spirosoma sp.]|nr:D-TA family PLP-dependent enzyme [Spirosoma sp.]
MNWYHLTRTDDIASPALLVSPEHVIGNIRAAIKIAGTAQRLRPHVKTHKMRAVTDLLLTEGIRQFKCATLSEARMLAEAAPTNPLPDESPVDVLLAYPLVGPAVTQLARLRTEFPAVHFSCLIDADAPAHRLSDAFADAPLDVYIDLNVGMNRTGINPANALMLYANCQLLPGIRVVGLHAYDGHVRDTDLTIRGQRAGETFALANGVRTVIADGGGPILPLVMGGTPSFSMHARQPSVLLSPGTFVFWDAGYADMVPDLPFAIATVLLTRVISVIDEQRLCLDLGHKSVAAENPLPRVIFPDHPDARPIGQSEEHLVVRVADASQHQPGDVWYGVPIHICPTVNLYDSAVVITNNEPTDTWAVTARGH